MAETYEQRLEIFRQADIYPVTCEDLSAGRSNLEVLDAVIAGGSRIIQLREKKISKKAIYELALEFRKRTEKHNVLLIINDYTDIALACGADGVHLGQDDLPVRAAKKIAPCLIIGSSSHSIEEASAAQKDGADYVNIGPIFPTGTKHGLHEFLGPDAIRRIAPILSIPFTVMGGINEGNMDQVLEAGARRIAMVTGITMAHDIAEKVRVLRRRIQSSTNFFI